jgi:hypothetical protein
MEELLQSVPRNTLEAILLKYLFYLIVLLFYVKMKSTAELIRMGTIEKKGNYLLSEHLITLLFTNIRHLQYSRIKVVKVQQIIT